MAGPRPGALVPPRVLGTLALAGVVAWVVAVLLLHALKSDQDPLDRYISEYAIGGHGWVMVLAFLALGLGLLALAGALSGTLERGPAKVAGVSLTAVAGVGSVIAGVFRTDPTGAPDVTFEGGMHLLGALMIFPSVVVGSFFVRAALRGHPHLAPFAARVRWMPYLLVLSALLAFGVPGEGPVGLAQRVLAAVMMAWLGALAWKIRATGAAAR